MTVSVGANFSLFVVVALITVSFSRFFFVYILFFVYTSHRVFYFNLFIISNGCSGVLYVAFNDRYGMCVRASVYAGGQLLSMCQQMLID